MRRVGAVVREVMERDAERDGTEDVLGWWQSLITNYSLIAKSVEPTAFYVVGQATNVK